ncbi:FMN-dependent NADH-azoreductase [Xylanibacillus composti]|uniref:FMN dependent NADH:quinone oxidoreductase n=1 Tax=Xylanibacillus composti TaxID=1572762 RepID=A0A8J4H3V7_9BACL|nr:FMN-dependent NADH-azoreductase [Xylanibacillus composti]MDT9724838.1 FMN-dependent NADH-azoreductase [Xylanibacillus composti]GIQ69071.1 FMN-dependent NADH-azoreductase 3 [Xylanibacillus composti]
MSTILFVKANNRPVEQAVSVKLYNRFLESYRNSHPEDTITELDLFAETLPYLDDTLINANFKVANGMEISLEEQQKKEIADRYLNQFLAADKVVFAFPLWNFSVPAVLHTYLDYLAQAGKTFKYTPEGPVGLIPDKKVALLHASGGIYSEGPAAPLEMSLNYVTNMMRFFGVQNIVSIRIEGHNQLPDRANQIIDKGLAQAADAAVTF